MDRFWRKVEKTETCWLWRGALLQRGGYGAFRLEGRTRRAHTVAWELCKGQPAKTQLNHVCNVASCVNPSHLYEGTKSQNSIDASKIGGLNNKLSEADVIEIRTLAAQGISNKLIAEKYGVTRQAIRAIVRKRNYAWVKI